mgnify:CR=1 FL=1
MNTPREDIAIARDLMNGALAWLRGAYEASDELPPVELERAILSVAGARDQVAATALALPIAKEKAE